MHPKHIPTVNVSLARRNLQNLTVDCEKLTEFSHQPNNVTYDSKRHNEDMLLLVIRLVGKMMYWERKIKKKK